MKDKMKENLCDFCKTNRSEINVNGVGSFCFKCFNENALKHMGIEDSFKHPEILTVKGIRFKLSHLVLGVNVFYTAEGIENDYLFKMSCPVKSNGQKEFKRFVKKIEDGISFKTIDEDSYVKRNGNVLIDDECFVVDGQKYTANEFIDLLSPYCGFNMTFQINDITDELLKEDEYLRPVKINHKQLINELEYVINTHSSNGFIHYSVIPAVDNDIYTITEKLDYLYNHGERETAVKTGLRMIEILEAVETNDNIFPLNHLRYIAEIIDKYNELGLLEKYRFYF